MTTFAYTGTLTDIGLGALVGKFPAMRVKPEREAFGPSGIVSAASVAVPVNAVTGAFSMTLIPSGELTPSVGGGPGVDYIIEVGRFEESIDGSKFVGWDTWKFTAVAGGGNIGDMSGGSLLAVWVGPPWPEGTPQGLYVSKITNWVGEKR